MLQSTGSLTLIWMWLIMVGTKHILNLWLLSFSEMESPIMLSLTGLFWFMQPGPENHNCYPDEHYVQTFLHVCPTFTVTYIFCMLFCPFLELDSGFWGFMSLNCVVIGLNWSLSNLEHSRALVNGRWIFEKCRTGAVNTGSPVYAKCCAWIANRAQDLGTEQMTHGVESLGGNWWFYCFDCCVFEPV